jgi:hypothetical protein
MTHASSRRGIKLVEVAIIVVVLVVLVALLLPATESAREASRRAQCINNLKLIGLAMHSYHDANGCFPPSMLERPKGHLLTATAPVPGTNNADGNGTDFSWHVMILPYLENKELYEKLDVAKGFPYDGNPTRKAAAAMLAHWSAGLSNALPPFGCPSFAGSPWSGAPEYPKESTAISNYVALGATHLASLYRTETQPFGGPSHPNGTIYPGSHTTLHDFLLGDGSTNTVIVCETREQNYAAWIDGTTAAVVGLAPQTNPTFERRESQKYYSPADGVRTTINWGSDDPGDKKYYLAPGEHSGSQPWTFGPSSFHPGIVNHLFGGGNVASIQDTIDPAIYMNLITRDGNDPTGPCCEPCCDSTRLHD